MRTIILLVSMTALTGALLLASCSTSQKAAGESAARNILYVCDCGPDCKCTTVKVQPGKCTCGMVLKAVHALKVEGDTALACACGPDCKCAFDAKDPTKCGCGKPIAKVSLKGTGIYFCNCGGSCMCNTFAASPGVCKCGMPLKKID